MNSPRHIQGRAYGNQTPTPEKKAKQVTRNKSYIALRVPTDLYARIRERQRAKAQTIQDTVIELILMGFEESTDE